MNGNERQHGYAGDMAFDILTMLVYILGIMTLELGDLVATGTPAGVGSLEPGDTVDVDVEVPVVGALVEPRYR